MPKPTGKSGKGHRTRKKPTSKTSRVTTRHASREKGLYNTQWGTIPGTKPTTPYAGEQGWLPPRPSKRKPTGRPNRRK